MINPPEFNLLKHISYCQRGGKLQICLKTTINETGSITNYLDGTDRSGDWC